MQQHKKLIQASVDWNQDTPVSAQFDDFYFNVQAGLDESQHVFLNGNKLAERFSNLKKDHFTIAETGFGTGLNFLAARQLWLDTAPEEAQLHFISVEKFPLSLSDLTQALGYWPELESGSRQLLQSYPTPVPGFHRISLDNGRVQLTLMLMDAIEAYSQLVAQVDAWFLDGFTPKKNHDMWNEQLFSQVARLSYNETTLSTFTVAGFVREGLQNVGFNVQKVPGFGRKLEMVYATFSPSSAVDQNVTPWFDLPISQYKPTHAIVIGAGIAGCSTAFSLAQRGIAVTIIERNSEIAYEGSGNRQGALYAKLPVSHNAQGQLHLLGLLHSHRLLHQQDPKQTFWSDCGLIQLATHEKELKRQRAMLEKTHFDHDIVRSTTSQEASDIAGIPTNYSGLYMPKGGWVSPKAFCQKLVQHPLIKVQVNCAVESINQTPDTHSWVLHLEDGAALSSDTVVICTAAEAKNFPQTQHLPIKPIRGQTSVSPVQNDTLKTVVCADGYISPSMDGQYCFGATFDLHDLSLDIRIEDHEKNLYKLNKALPTLAENMNLQTLGGKAAYRCSTSDYLPIAGPVPNYDAFIHDYAKLRVDSKWKFQNVPPAHFKGLFINIGHGSKGLISGPICGEILVASITGEPIPVEKPILDAVNPARFVIKSLIRKTI